MDQTLDAISRLLRRAADDDPTFPPTLLFNEGWMLRLVLQWFAAREDPIDHPLSFAPGAGWFSEARLASTFLPRSRSDKFAEGHTHADGVVGHFRIGEASQAELKLAGDATQFVVIEAKMFSGLSKGTTHARTYNQAARNVACMAHLLECAKLDPTRVPSLAFYVLAPEAQIDDGVFSKYVNEASLEQVVQTRVGNYDEPKMEWFEGWFKPTLATMEIGCLSWESAIDAIKEADPNFGADLEAFYTRCLNCNHPAGKGAER